MIQSAETRSEYQQGPQEIRVLLPDTYAPDKKYRVVYVLPVEAGFNRQFGYGLGEFEKLKVQDTYDVILVQMGFKEEPWFGDHARDSKVRQASYLKDFVVPFIEKNYSTFGTPEGRLLFGFSKSGWGAFSLIFKYPEFFGYAAAWDAPFLLNQFHYGMEKVFGTVERLNEYRPDLLARQQAGFFRKKNRLVVTGENLWGKLIPAPDGGSHTRGFHKLLEAEGVIHFYDGTLNAPHRWDPAWMKPTLQSLMRLAAPVGL